MMTSDKSRAKRRAALIVLLLFGLAMAATALWPLQPVAREARFAIPPGTWANRMAGQANEILPQTIYLTLGLSDILVLENQDSVPQIFGPTLIMPGQRFKLPFDLASEYQFACTAHADGQMTVIVAPHPDLGWPRLRWRLQQWWRQLPWST